MTRNLLTVAATLAAAVVVGWAAGQANAAVPTPDQVQQGTDAYLRTALRWDRPARVLVDTPDAAMPMTTGGSTASGFYPFARPGEIDLAHSVVVGLTRPRGPFADSYLETATHESLHYDTGCYGPIEEWITEAKALDELPFVARAVWGRPLMQDMGLGDSNYQGGVRRIRALSKLATGARSWRSPQAWAFRDALWRAPMLPDGCAVRDQLLASPLLPDMSRHGQLENQAPGAATSQAHHQAGPSNAGLLAAYPRLRPPGQLHTLARIYPDLYRRGQAEGTTGWHRLRLMALSRWLAQHPGLVREGTLRWYDQRPSTEHNQALARLMYPTRYWAIAIIVNGETAGTWNEQVWNGGHVGAWPDRADNDGTCDGGEAYGLGQACERGKMVTWARAAGYRRPWRILTSARMQFAWMVEGYAPARFGSIEAAARQWCAACGRPSW